MPTRHVNYQSMANWSTYVANEHREVVRWPIKLTKKVLIALLERERFYAPSERRKRSCGGGRGAVS